MNTTRVEIPLTLPTPRFEDESTIATARKVKPIGRARITARWRKVRAVVPLLLGATLCGALGAAVVNYYERRGEAQLPKADAYQFTKPVDQAKPQPPPVVTSADLSGGKRRQDENELDDSSNKAKGIDPQEAQIQTVKAVPQNPETAEPATPKILKKHIDEEASKITRKRRVRPVDQESPAANKTGTSRIADIFSGQDP